MTLEARLKSYGLSETMQEIYISLLAVVDTDTKDIRWSTMRTVTGNIAELIQFDGRLLNDTFFAELRVFHVKTTYTTARRPAAWSLIVTKREIGWSAASSKTTFLSIPKVVNEIIDYICAGLEEVAE